VESTIIVAIALLALGGGAIALLARQGMLPSGLPALRGSGAAAAPADDRLGPDRDASRAEITPGSSLVATVEAAAVAPPARPSTSSPQPHWLDLAAARDEAVQSRLDRIEERLDALGQIVSRQSDDARLALSQIASQLASRDDAQDARHEAALERLRVELIATAATTAARHPEASGPRPDVCSELYARTARLEAALAAVTNPVLLPGEPYAPPAELLPEALIWENWNEVGERAFALAEHFSAQRLHLSADTRAEMTRFVTTLRTLLTRSVYPNLLPDPDRIQREALRTALEEIAAELPRMRDLLEREYRGEDPS
jgi:hypothetical protein